jgi:hypothetical protein
MELLEIFYDEKFNKFYKNTPLYVICFICIYILVWTHILMKCF